MMIIHLFNSSLVSGPETLVIPALKNLSSEWGEVQVWNLEEKRKGNLAKRPLQYAQSFSLNTLAIQVLHKIDLHAIVELSRQLEKAKPLIVHAHDVKASVYLCLARVYLKLAAKKLKFKTVTTHHGIHSRLELRIKLYEWAYRFLFLRFFDLVLAVCTSDGADLVEAGIAKRRTFVHLNGVEGEKIEETDFDARQLQVREKWQRELNLDLKGKIVIGVAARLSPEKNHQLLIEGLYQFGTESSRQPWVCFCFGSGALEKSLKQKAKKLGLERSILFLGYRPSLGQELVGLDLMLSLSRAEGLPVNLIEAGWSSVPVLSTSVNGVNDLLPEGDPVFSYSRLPARPTNAEFSIKLRSFFESEPLRRKVGQAFQKRVEHSFSGRIWLTRLEELYRLLMARGEE